MTSDRTASRFRTSFLNSLCISGPSLGVSMYLSVPCVSVVQMLFQRSAIRRSFVTLMRIDLHVHTRERSACGRSATDEMIHAAIARQLDALVITDHNRLVPAEELALLNAKYAPFQVFGGIEISLPGEHVLVLGIQEPELEYREWTYPALHTYVEERVGFLALAHPFRFAPEVALDLKRYPPHGMELHSRNTPRAAARQIRTQASAAGSVLLANSDAHHRSQIGRYYNLLVKEPANEQELLASLKAGAFESVAPA